MVSHGSPSLLKGSVSASTNTFGMGRVTSRFQCGPYDVLHNRVSMVIIIHLKFHISGYAATRQLQRFSSKPLHTHPLMSKAYLRPSLRDIFQEMETPEAEGRVTWRTGLEGLGGSHL